MLTVFLYHAHKYFEQLCLVSEARYLLVLEGKDRIQLTYARPDEWHILGEVRCYRGQPAVELQRYEERSKPRVTTFEVRWLFLAF